MYKTTRKQLMNLFMQQVWNEGNFSRLSDMVAADYSVSQDDYDPFPWHSARNASTQEKGSARKGVSVKTTDGNPASASSFL